MGGYIIDLYCPALRLAVELDGDVHLESTDYDAERGCHLATLGVTVIRIRNEDVLRDLDAVIAALDNVQRSLLPPASGGGREGGNASR